MQRTDIHRPSAIIPEDYDFVAFECIKIEGIGDCEAILRERARIQAHMARTGGTYSQHEHGGNCMICGNVFATYTILFYHAKTNVYVRAGQDCAQKLEMSYGDFNYFTARVLDARAAVAGKAKAKAILSDLGLDAAWQYFEYVGPDREEQIIRDIVGKLVQYGSVSEKQVAFVRSLLNKIDTRAERMAQRAAETAAAAPVPTGRIDITGVVLSTKWVSSEYGETLKMLVKAEAGYKVWGTVPQSMDVNDVIGKTVSFRASVEPSKDDPKFGWFKRPMILKQPS